MATHCNEIVMIERSEPVKSGTQWTRLAALHPVKESNKVEHFQNAATSPCVLIIRKSTFESSPPKGLLTNLRRSSFVDGTCAQIFGDLKNRQAASFGVAGEVDSNSPPLGAGRRSVEFGA